VETFDDSGEKVAHSLLTAFAVGMKGVTDKRTSPHNVPTAEPPKRAPDSSVEQQTSLDQVRPEGSVHYLSVQSVGINMPLSFFSIPYIIIPTWLPCELLRRECHLI
jgi:hypothetical protein